ncbi:MAG: hypothetical protein HY446_00290 [Candidatus Niyogibacteria bacterium]|nr:hypothetical protein [Candidatus Niyogibacteria bacterium]
MKKFPAFGAKEFKVFQKFKSPQKIQDFVENIPINFELEGDTCFSPLMVLKENKAHCVEGAMLAAAILWRHGQKPFLMDFETTAEDESHVVALFRQNGCWGAISKTNHAVLRYRDPVYKTPRELAMSYFNEYFLDSGLKTLRRFSAPFDLSKRPDEWLVSDKNLSYIVDELIESPHFKIADAPGIKTLRPAEPIEIEATKLTRWKKDAQK